MNLAVERLATEARARTLFASVASRLNRNSVVPVSLFALVVAGAGDFLTGVELTFTLLYIFPIALGTWFRSRSFGIGLSATAVAAGALAAVAGRTHHHPLLWILWNQGGLLGVFLIVTWLVDAVRDQVVEERRKHGLTVTQLRHAERLHVIGMLAAGVAHELGTPLNVITGTAELIGSGQVTPEKLGRASRTILEQSERMIEIISHLLDFGRRGGSSREVTDLRVLVDRSSALLERAARKAGSTLVVDPQATSALAEVNPAEVEQVLINLILNAIQAMPEGGQVKLDCRVEHSAQVGASSACFIVEDEGSGIPPADLARIFDPFFTTKGVGKGTGLGLSVSYGIVQDHGGSIQVRSTVDRGSRFIVRFPLAE